MADPDKRTARQITASLRILYPHAPIATSVAGPGRFTVRMPEAPARYWGAARDPAYAAAWLAWHIGRPCRIPGLTTIHNGQGHTALVAVELTGGPMPPDPRGSAGLPEYDTPAQVLGDATATRTTASLVHLAIKGGLRPHIDPASPDHGLYCVLISFPSRDGLFGGIWVSETTGTAVRGSFCWGNHAPQQRAAGVGEIRRHLTSWLDLTQGRTRTEPSHA
jgi:hypothetical protein